MPRHSSMGGLYGPEAFIQPLDEARGNAEAMAERDRRFQRETIPLEAEGLNVPRPPPLEVMGVFHPMTRKAPALPAEEKPVTITKRTKKRAATVKRKRPSIAHLWARTDPRFLETEYLEACAAELGRRAALVGEIEKILAAIGEH